MGDVTVLYYVVLFMVVVIWTYTCVIIHRTECQKIFLLYLNLNYKFKIIQHKNTHHAELMNMDLIHLKYSGIEPECPWMPNRETGIYSSNSGEEMKVFKLGSKKYNGIWFIQRPPWKEWKVDWREWNRKQKIL